MSITAIQLFEEAVAGLQRAAVTGHYENGISTEQFAVVMFQTANSLGSVHCWPADENHLCFAIGNDAERVYKFPVNRIFRSVLGGIAQLIWSRTPQTLRQELFNAYGDKQEIIYTSVDGSKTYFYVETANKNGAHLYFTISARVSSA